MKRYFIAIALFTCLSFRASADHITGGEMYYTYGGFSNGQNTYNITLKLFMRCNSGRQFPDPAVISVFDKAGNNRIVDISAALSSRQTISLANSDPCIANPPTVCYEVAYYNISIPLPLNQSGYTLASEVNYRINGISNINASQIGATYTSEIPGSSPQANGHINISAIFTGSDLVIVCAKNYFSYSFAAHDDDGDLLRYSFCSAYASTNTGVNGAPTGAPPYTSVPYRSPGFSASLPLGNNVKIDPQTGLITGIAPDAGIYIVTVCVEEIRNNTVIATQRKDLQINIADCSIAAALLDKEYMLCRDTRSVSINNLSNSPLIGSYEWEVVNPAGSSIYTSNNVTLSYTFPANGTYTVRLTINKGQACSDTTSAKVFVYPGFIPDFDFAGICITKPTVFTDATTTATGTVNSWKWDFGESSTTLDVSSLQNPAYTFPLMGQRSVRLIVTNTDGCRDTVIKIITIIDKPPIIFAFRDTLICLNDQVQLQAAGTGIFSWSPNIAIINANTTSPTVSPATTTTYYADLNSDGCLNRDSIKVRVVDHVTLQSMNDTTICSGDTIQLRIVSDGLRYSWTPADQLINATVKNPLAITAVTTPYNVIASIGGCSANEQINVTAIPFPSANAGKDIEICYKAVLQLHAATDGTSWQWLGLNID